MLAAQFRQAVLGVLEASEQDVSLVYGLEARARERHLIQQMLDGSVIVEYALSLPSLLHQHEEMSSKRDDHGELWRKKWLVRCRALVVLGDEADVLGSTNAEDC